MKDIIETFFTSIGCMDGRVQQVIAMYGKELFTAEYPDTITEAGMVGLLAKEVDEKLAKALQFKIVTVSIEKHRSKGIIVHGHAECAGNPVDDTKHKNDIKKAVSYISQHIENNIPVKGVFVRRSSENPAQWIIEEL